NAWTKTSPTPNSSTPPFNTILLSATPTRKPSIHSPACSGGLMPPTACTSEPSKSSRTSRPRFPNRHHPCQLIHLRRPLASFRKLHAKVESTHGCLPATPAHAPGEVARTLVCEGLFSIVLV